MSPLPAFFFFGHALFFFLFGLCGAPLGGFGVKTFLQCHLDTVIHRFIHNYIRPEGDQVEIPGLRENSDLISIMERLSSREVLTEVESDKPT